MTLTRRACLKSATLLGAIATLHPRPSRAAPLPSARLLIGGPLSSTQGQFAELISETLTHSLGLDLPPELTPDISQDGVRAANLFDANSAPDGSTAIIAPGSALLAALTGDPRVHYDFTRWTPLLTAHTTTIVVGRIEIHKTLRSRLTGLFHNQPVRLAVSRPTGPELDALLGLSLLGLRPIPVPGFTTTEEALKALDNGDVDAVRLLPHTLDLPLENILSQLPAGTSPLYYTGDLSDIHANTIPNFLETYQQIRHRTPTSHPLYGAWQAVSATACTPLIVALPMLTPDGPAKTWGKALWNVALDPTVHQWAEKHHFQLAAGGNAAPFLSRTIPDLTATLAFRRWIGINTPRWRSGQETKLF